jgi:hypothetical protein
MTFTGGKNGSGVFQRIINMIPPHEVYIEPFLGSGAIMRHKQPAPVSYGVEIDPDTLSRFPARDVWNLHLGCGITFLQEFPFLAETFVYCDPPYLLSTRKGRRYYRYELSHGQHVELLRTVTAIPAKVLISGYDSELYNDMLTGWRKETFIARTRGGNAEECLWFNYERPEIPADLTHYGDDYRERERIKRKRSRWVKRLRRMPAAEREILLSAIAETFSPGPIAMNGGACRPLSPETPVRASSTSTKNDRADPIAQNGGTRGTPKTTMADLPSAKKEILQ